MKLASTLLAASAVVLGFGSASFAADLIVEPPAYVEPVVVNNWEGGYIGAFLGGGWASVDLTDDYFTYECDYYSVDCNFSLGGWLFGIQGGYNFSLGTGSFVLGIAGDIAWADLSGDNADDAFINDILDLSNSVQWEGSIRGLIGYDGGVFMPYFTAGVAFAGVDHNAGWWDGDTWWTDDANSTHVGGTVGVGVMFAAAENIAIDLQYRHSWYGEQEFDIGWGSDNPVFDLNTDRFTAGVNFMF